MPVEAPPLGTVAGFNVRNVSRSALAGQPIIDLLTACATLLAILGLFALWKRDRAVAAFIAATIFDFVFLSAGSEAGSRFRVPVVPLMAISAGAAVEAIAKGVRECGSEWIRDLRWIIDDL